MKPPYFPHTNHSKMWTNIYTESNVIRGGLCTLATLGITMLFLLLQTLPSTFCRPDNTGLHIGFLAGSIQSRSGGSILSHPFNC